ncbi:MAG TPA: PDZ domain-containing protein, partial [Candidatus Limnocylindrales bacterium]|nr:PDZ domain-containing protein [Candidatus Limnocylindrales bacterium]
FDARGRVIGINAQIRSNSGLAEGVGFAVPINAAKRSMDQLIDRGTVAYGYVGVRADDLWPALARRLGLSVTRGALIADVIPDGPADEAGFQGSGKSLEFQGAEISTGGDVVVGVDGIRIRSADDLVRIVTNSLTPGKDAVFTIIRDNRRLDVPVHVTERPAGPSSG